MQITLSKETYQKATLTTLMSVIQKKIFKDGISYGEEFEIDGIGQILFHNHMLPEAPPAVLRKATEDELLLWNSVKLLRKEFSTK